LDSVARIIPARRATSRSFDRRDHMGSRCAQEKPDPNVDSEHIGGARRGFLRGGAARLDPMAVLRHE